MGPIPSMRIRLEISSGYRENGYFPEAFVNMMAFLGWNPGTTQEMFQMDELIEAFSLDRVGKSGAKFDPDKTKWFNQQYLQSTSDDILAKLFLPVIANEMRQSDTPCNDITYITKIVGLIKERASFVSDFWNLSNFFFVAPTVYDAKASKKQWKEGTPDIMKSLITVITYIDNYTSENIETVVKEWLTTQELGFGKVMPPFRLALVGAMSGPHLFDIAEMIGKEETVHRIQKAVDTL